LKHRAEVQTALQEMRKLLDKVARCIDAASRASDPSRNAELMHTLYQAQDQLDAARRALGKASGTAIYLGNQLLALLPVEEEQPTLVKTV
jgi:hypothetical protein